MGTNAHIVLNVEYGDTLNSYLLMDYLDMWTCENGDPYYDLELINSYRDEMNFDELYKSAAAKRYYWGPNITKVEEHNSIMELLYEFADEFMQLYRYAFVNGDVTLSLW